MVKSLVWLNYRIDKAWNDVLCSTKWWESLSCQTLQVRVTSDIQMIQSSNWPKWRCMLWHNVNSRIFVGQQMSFEQVCWYVNYKEVGIWVKIETCLMLKIKPTENNISINLFIYIDLSYCVMKIVLPPLIMYNIYNM